MEICNLCKQPIVGIVYHYARANGQVEQYHPNHWAETQQGRMGMRPQLVTHKGEVITDLTVPRKME